MRLYRDSLKLARSWCVDRGVFNEEATRIQVHHVLVSFLLPICRNFYFISVDGAEHTSILIYLC